MTQRFEVDGVPVVGHEGVFSRAFDMAYPDAEEVVYDRPYVLVVVATTLPPAYRTDKYGDLIRRDRFQVTAAKVAKGSLGAELAEMFELDMIEQGQLPFGQPDGLVTMTPEMEARARAQPTPEVARVASQRVQELSNGSMPAPGPSGPVSVPVGVPVGRVAPTGDDTLRRFLEGGS